MELGCTILNIKFALTGCVFCLLTRDRLRQEGSNHEAAMLLIAALQVFWNVPFIDSKLALKLN
jgi:hypothetical protein